MQAQIELTPARAEALARLEKATGESRTVLIGRALDSYLEQCNYDAWANAKIQRGIDDIEAGRSLPHDKAMSHIRSSLRERFGKTEI